MPIMSPAELKEALAKQLPMTKVEALEQARKGRELARQARKPSANDQSAPSQIAPKKTG